MERQMEEVSTGQPTTEYNSAATYFAAKPATELAGIVLGKSQSFFNMLRANAYLEKLSRMSGN